MTSYFCSLFFCKERQKERELKKKTLTFQLLLSCGWFVIWMAGVQTFTFIRLPNALSNLGVGGFGPNRVKPFGLSSVVLGAGALALVSFLQGERQTHTHTHREPSEAFLKLFGLFIHLKTDSELTTISVLVHNFLLFACPQDIVVVVFVFFVF